MCLYLVNVLVFCLHIVSCLHLPCPLKCLLYADSCLHRSCFRWFEREHYIEVARRVRWHPFLGVKSEWHAVCLASSVVECLEEYIFCLSLSCTFPPCSQGLNPGTRALRSGAYYGCVLSVGFIAMERNLYQRVKQGATERQHY